MERATELRCENANGIHALTHAMFEVGASEDADSLLGRWLPAYAREGITHGHLAWHQALIALERGDAEGALNIFAAHVHHESSLGMPINKVSDGASFLWRMSIYGYQPPQKIWKGLADYSRKAFPSGGQAFIDSHLLMIAAATGDRAELEARLRAPDALVAENGLGAGPVVLAIGRSLAAFAEGNYVGCAVMLEPVAN